MDNIDNIKEKLEAAEHKIRELEKENIKLRDGNPFLSPKYLELLFNISGDILRLTDSSFDESIIKDLEVLGNYTNADACIALLFNDSKDGIAKAYRWQNKTYNHPELDETLNDPALLKSLHDILDKNQILEYANNSSIDNDRLFEILGKGFNFKSGFMVPLQLKAETLGAIGFANYVSKAVFSSDDIHIIKLLANLFIYTLVKRQNEDKLKSIITEKDKLVGIIAHDLRGPFGAILSLTEMLSKEFLTLTLKEIRNYSNTLYSSSLGVNKMLENLLDWSRLQMGLFPFTPMNTNLQVAVYSSIEVLLTKAALKNIEIINSIPDDVFVFADAAMLDIIIRNLVSNSLKFTDENGFVLIDCLQKDDSTVVINIKDNGRGMAQSTIEYLLNYDRTISTPGTANEQGTGLGLILCREFIEKNNGSISVDSHPGLGSTFSFTLQTGRDEKPNHNNNSPDSVLADTPKMKSTRKIKAMI